MGSGCTSNCPTYFANTMPDTSIEYTGPAITALGICTKDKLNELEAVILQKLIDYSTGVGINIPDIDLTACDLFVDFIACCSTCTDLNCLMKVIFTALCTLYNDFSTLQSEITSLLNGPYTIPSCITGLGINPKLNQIVQQLLIQFCTLYNQVQSLATTVASLGSSLPATIGNFLNSALSSCQGSGGMTKSGSGASFTASFKGFVPVGGLIPYAGPTAGLFDSTGLGITNTPMCGWAKANGNNGTINMVEQVPVGAGIGTMGGTVPSNASGANYPLFAKVGEAFHTLTVGEIPSCTLSGSTLPSTVTGTVNANDSRFKFGPDDHALVYPPQGSPRVPGTGVTITFNIPSINISGQSNGGGGKHNNVQPSTALMYIQRLS